MALDKVAERLERITRAFNEASIPYALVGGQAVAIWVSSRNPHAVRTTKDVDILLRREDLARATASVETIGLEYQEVAGVGMFMEREDPGPHHAVHIVWAGEKVRASYLIPAPVMEEREDVEPGKPVVTLDALVRMKLQAHRKHDQVHILDMIGVGLIGEHSLEGLPPLLAERLRALLEEYRRDYGPESLA